ncbi:MAG: 16S rRNA (guanine(527)-N(7))-methyltransferase RsmG [Flavobacteriales bacterium]|jgi:16S rRNA (guanine527-N7)-methyltransferase|nr:16S rRNA (guanine(527)-N(7))-methyltransferase RsmG [Flavobacteriales bacterium]MBT5698388.1 16S rRNA (guanine(527)-N(7))-methyltransferase RsmG [Flavobacteriales bacterium]MBT6815383.1 16S rRNA (guanine(527)-N(7))-methyltransferase RsmG [Flavobacteriales bacterium]MBT7481457.1 16S rRNA (guanine(527)-N(7))-methyltransferase RsmG [Flavobacteriales bacterium]MBT7725968.1 16S rRNA (guanine(527)-N(7))-methyltransferase RsmG [Flavobacteriales bacterium]
MDIILKYFPDILEKQIRQFSQLQELYNEWNSQINVISRKDMENLYLKHVLHSLAIAKVVSFADGTKVLDVGTGGGFPGVPLAILFPNVDFLLVDSIGKKIKVVNEVANSIGLKNLRAEHKRAEQVNGQFDFVVSRAVTKMKVFHQWVRKRISTKQKNTFFNGILYLKGGDLTEELKGIKNVELYNIPDFFEEEFFETKKIVYISL